MNELSLFTGIGGGLLGSKALGWKTVCAVEIEPYCQSILMQRQNEGNLEPFPIWDDIRTFRGSDWRGKVDIVTAGFPCPAFSRAGKQGAFTQDDLFFEAIRIIQECQPAVIMWENVEGFVKWKDTLRNEVEAIGYEWRDGVFNTLDFGIPQNRPRYYCVCFSRRMLSSPQLIWRFQRKKSPCVRGILPVYSDTERRWTPTVETKDDWRTICANSERSRSTNRLPYRMDRLKAVGNSQSPQCFIGAWKLLTQGT